MSPSDNLPDAFEPLGFSELARLSAVSRRSLAWDFALAGQDARLRAMESIIPWGKLGANGEMRVALDVELCALALWTAEPDTFDRLANVIEAAASERGEWAFKLSSSRPRDFGALLAHWACSAIGSLELGQPEAAAEPIRRALRLARSPNFALDTAGDELKATSFRVGELAYGFLPLDPSDGALVRATLEALGLSSGLHALPVSIVLAHVGEPTLLRALCARPELATALASHASEIPSTTFAPAASFYALRSKIFWTRAPAVGQLLLDLADPDGTRAPAPRIAHSMLLAGPACGGLALDALMTRSGDRFMVDACKGSALSSPSCELVRKRSLELLAEGTLVGNGFAALLADVFTPRLGERFDDVRVRGNFLRSTLLSPLPGLSESVRAAWAASHGPDSDPFLQSLRLSNIEQHLEAICHCGRPELVAPALDAWGLEEVQSFPERRQGLDSSASMWIMTKAPLPIFEAALDWFATAGDGELARQAELKAWVSSDSQVRKKGDLLAACVAQGNVGAAESLLRRLPGLDTSPAREVAKAIGRQGSGHAAGAAVSAWETLLFKKTFELQGAAVLPVRKAPRL